MVDIGVGDLLNGIFRGSASTKKFERLHKERDGVSLRELIVDRSAGRKGRIKVVRSRDSRSPISIGMDWGARVTSIGLEFALPAVFGHFLDKWLGSAPWLTIGGAILGMVVGMTHILRLPAELAKTERRRSGAESSRDHDRTNSVDETSSD